MARMIVAHALIKWKEGTSRRTAYRGETVNIGGAELKRLTALGALVKPGDFPADEPAPGDVVTPIVTPAPLVDRDAVAAAVLRRKLDLPDDTDDEAVLATLDARLASSSAVTGAGDMVVGGPTDVPGSVVPGSVDAGDVVEPDGQADEPDGQADEPDARQPLRPAQSAPKSEWEQYAIDTRTYTADEAARKSKQQLIANTPVPS